MSGAYPRIEVDLSRADCAILIIAVSTAIEAENAALRRLHDREFEHQDAICERILLLQRYDVLRLNLSAAASGNEAPMVIRDQMKSPSPGGYSKRNGDRTDDSDFFIPTRR
jgi:hypothetical protein